MTDSHAPPLRRTPLTGVHERLGAVLTGFAGWQMPLRYGSETAEHQAVRTAAGLFDLSHMGEITVSGPDAAAALDFALVGQPSALAPGRARYTMICAPDGGILDDLIVYRLAGDDFLVVANAANSEVVLRELTARAAQGSPGARVTDRTDDYALIALQGPNAARILAPITDADLSAVRYYASYPAAVAGCPLLLARTGYTGEDGFELFARPQDAERIWQALTAAGAADGLAPAGLAARDTLRLEAGMPLYGNELGPDVTPFDAGLGRVVKLDKPGDFVGRVALAERAQATPERELVGLVGQTRRVPRHGYEVLWEAARHGTVTSGAPSPTLGRPIAMAYLEADVARQARQAEQDGKPGRLAVDIRGSAEPAVLVPLPFYHRPAGPAGRSPPQEERPIMTVPEELRYTSEHEWVAITGTTALVGISDHAQNALGDVVYVSAPAPGSKVTAGEPCGEVESTKSVSDLYSPVDGEVTEVNPEIEENPGLVNSDPYGAGWLFKVAMPAADLPSGLLSAAEYEDLIKDDS